MQEFYDRYFELISREDLNVILKSYRFKVQGFRDLAKAPHQLLIREMKMYHRQNGHFFSNIIDMIMSFVREEYCSFHDFDEFILKMELDYEIEPYQIIALMYKHFPVEFEAHIELIKKNIEEGNLILNGLTKKDVSVLDKLINNITVANLYEEDPKILFLDFEEELFEMVDEDGKLDPFSQKYKSIKEAIDGTEGNLVSVISKLKLTHEEKFLAFIAFLLVENNLEQERYQSFLHFAKNGLLMNRYKAHKKDIKTYSNYFDKVLEAYKEKKEKSNLLEEKCKELEEQVNVLSKQNLSLQGNLTQQELLTKAFKKKIDGYPFYIIVKEKEMATLSTTILRENVITLSQFNKIIKDTDVCKGNIFFINRTMFSTSKEWLKMQQLFSQHHITYRELYGYGVEEHIEQIISYFYEIKGTMKHE
ncbi:MAG: hypothetical protein ACI35O_14435 [Bacillaceae bacterium]